MLTIRCDWPDCREFIRVAHTEPALPSSVTGMRAHAAREGWTSALRTAHKGEHTVRERHDYCPSHRKLYDEFRPGRRRDDRRPMF